MFSRSIIWFICVFVAAVIATEYRHPESITGSDFEVTTYYLRNSNLESSTTEAVPEFREITDVDLGPRMAAAEDAVVTTVVGDTLLAAHRAVLAANSPVFASMLRHDMLGAASSQIEIADVEGPVQHQMLCCLYTLQVPQLPSMARQLLASADKFSAPVLKAQCEEQVATQLSIETAAAIAVLAVRHSCKTLTQAVVAFTKAHTNQVMATQGWADARRSQPEYFSEVIRLLFNPSAESRDLIEAAEEGTVQKLRTLLASGLDVEVRDGGGNTALHWAAYGGHLQAVRLLVKAGAEVDARDNWQSTPLHVAAYYGQAAVVPLLVAYNADLNARDERGRTPLHWAVLRDHAQAATALLQAGADKWPRDETGETPLDIARRYNKKHLTEIFRFSSFLK